MKRLRAKTKSLLSNYPSVFPGELVHGNKLRTLTSAIRTNPDFIIVGESKCGTTTLYNRIAFHPQVRSALLKEINYFNWNSHRPTTWYKAHFPIKASQELSRWITGKSVLSGEATPLYFFHKEAARRIRDSLPNIKIIICFRDPVERALSHYWDIGVRIGNETRSFECAAEEEIEAINKYGANPGRFKNDWNERLYQYLVRGIYAAHLPLWQAVFPVEQIFVLDSYRLKSETTETLNQIYRFLGLDEIGNGTGKSDLNVGSYDPMSPGTRVALREFYEPFNLQLEKLVGRQFSWMKRDYYEVPDVKN